MLAEYGLLDLMGDRMPDPAMLGAVLDLFNGHPVPALKRQRWAPAPSTSRRTAFAAHLLGVAYAGSYPFLGVPEGRCRCLPGAHLCDGLGTRYLCVDLDDKRGEGGMDRLVAHTTWAAGAMGYSPITFTSRSGQGAHVYLFFDEPVPTTEAYTLGRALVAKAGAEGRADILPSAGHPTGFGTMHALPLSPQTVDRGGGLLLDESQRPVLREAEVIDRLRAAHFQRDVFRPREALAAGVTSGDANPCETRIGSPHRGQSQAPRTNADPTIIAAGGEEIVRQMMRKHPQFRRALEVEGDCWKGGRSARDAHLAAMLVRQGVRPLTVAQALLRLPGTKAAERGLGYALTVAQHAVFVSQRPKPAQAVPLAGTPRKTVRGATPWRDRQPPPLDYGGERNPWWEPHVQARMTGRTAYRDRVVLAYLIDRWHRGVFPRRQFFLGRRDLGEALKMPPSTAANAVKRLAERYPDVLRVTPGVPHETLRLATAFDLVGARSHDRVSWAVTAGQSVQERLYSEEVEREEAMKDVHAGGDQAQGQGPGVARRYPGARPTDDPSRPHVATQARA